MSHCDPTLLGLAALGEPVPDEDLEHARGCAACGRELAELMAVVAVARQAPTELPSVPASVWDGIVAQLAAAPEASAPAGARHALHDAGPGQAPPQPLADVVQLAARPRRRPVAGFALAAMAGAVVGGGVMWAALDTGGAGAGEEPLAIAQAVLNPLDAGVAAPGEATVLTGPDGQVIRVDARGLPARSGFYEVWLLDAAATRLVALGALPSGSVGTFTVPPGVSIEEFPVVDISLEPYDGDPGHSHDSLLRGTLEA